MHMNKNKKRVNNRKWNYSMPLIQTDELTATETNTHRIREKQKVKYLLYLHSTIMSWEHYTMYKKSRVVSKYHLTEGTKFSCRGQWGATNALTSVVCRWNLWPDLVERRTKTKGGGEWVKEVQALVAEVRGTWRVRCMSSKFTATSWKSKTFW